MNIRTINDMAAFQVGHQEEMQIRRKNWFRCKSRQPSPCGGRLPLQARLDSSTCPTSAK
jgi:hypothetical protein